MKRVVAVLALALVVLGCASDPEPRPQDERVQLLTGYPNNTVKSCYASGFFGQVVVDPQFGTALIDDQQHRRVIGWPPGYTGWRFGSEVRVLDPAGQVMVVTGRRYEVLQASSVNLADWPELPDKAFWSCGGAIPSDTDRPATSPHP